MKPAPQARSAPEPTRPPGRLPAIILAVLVHAAFFGLIVFGVNWQSQPVPPVEVEVWDKLPPVAKTAPPKAAEPRPEPKPEPKPEPPKPEPAKPEPEPPKAKPEPPRPDPAIALKAEREKRERLEKLKAEERKKADEKKKAEADEKKKAEEKKRAQEEAAQKKREEEKRRKDEEAAREAAERARAEAQSARQKEIATWVDRIKVKIRSRANVPDTVTGTPEVHVRIRILPGGEVLDIAITKRSGNAAYDTAIERAIRSASPLPVPDASSELFPTFRDLNLQIRHER